MVALASRQEGQVSLCTTNRFHADAEEQRDLLHRPLFLIPHPAHLVLLGMDKAGGRPPTRPRFRTASSPSLVRSEICSRSNCAMLAKARKISRPAGVVVLMS